MSKDDKNREPDFLEKKILLPRTLWTRIENICTRDDREPSELVAEAVRRLLGGGQGGSPASVGGVTSPGAGGAIADLAEQEPQAVEADRVTASAIENQLADLYDEPLESDKLRTRLREIMARVETRDHFIDSHSDNVARLALTVARAVEAAEEILPTIELAGLAHDLGKSHIPEDVLGKKGRLTPEEWALVKRYPEFGAEMLTPFDHLAPVVEIVRHHQERWDGSGYPEGLQGDDIPLGAQVVGICDVFDVLTSDRAYRPALPEEVAIKTIEGGIGRLWNPVVAEALIRITG